MLGKAATAFWFSVAMVCIGMLVGNAYGNGLIGLGVLIMIAAILISGARGGDGGL